MSFIFDFFKELKIDDPENKIVCNLVLGEGVRIVAKYRLVQMEDEFIVLKIKKEQVKITGRNLVIKNISKGEVMIIGDVFGVTKV